MNAGRARPARETRQAPEAVKRVPHVLHVGSRAVNRQEETRTARTRMRGVAVLGIGPQGLHGRGVQWHFAGFVEFAVADDEACLSRIDVGAIERDRFADPQAGRGEQPKQRIGRAPDAARLQAPARGEQRLHLRVGIEIRGLSLLRDRNEVA